MCPSYRSCIYLVRYSSALVFIWLQILFAVPPSVNAATIHVDDGCSLANAIRSANGDPQSDDMNRCGTGDSGADTISLGRDVILHEALPAITGELTIEGNHHTLRRADDAEDMRLLTVKWSGDLRVNNLTLLNGRLSGIEGADYGGAIGLENGASLAVNNSMFRDNHAEYGGGAIGGIGYKATIQNSLFINNSASHEGGDGGAVLSEGGAVSVANSSFLSNSASSGGAITAQYGSALEVYRSEFIDNSARYGGGAIVLDGNLNISASSFVENRAEARAGAIYAHGSVVLENSTFYGNELEAEDFGSAVEMFAAIATLHHVTIVNSRAPILAWNYSKLYMVNSVIAGGMSVHCEVEDGSLIHLNVNNWLEYGSCEADHWGELEFSPPRGRPAVVPLYSNSYLIDRAPDDAYCLDADQRGMPRPAGYGCDIGAFEGSNPHPDSQPAADQSAEDATNQTVCDASLSGSIMVESAAPGAQCQEVSAVVGENPDVIAAVNVSGYIGASVIVCFEGDGRVVLLESEPLALTNRGYVSKPADGRTCALVDRVGMIALVSTDSEAARVAVRDLTDCTITTSSALNLRTEDGGDVLALVPANAALAALARNDDWFQVEYQDQLGWVSSDYVSKAGNCG